MPERCINLAGTGCPMNLVYVKVELAGMVPGQALEDVLGASAR